VDVLPTVKNVCQHRASKKLPKTCCGPSLRVPNPSSGASSDSCLFGPGPHRVSASDFGFGTRTSASDSGRKADMDLAGFKGFILWS
jgi:hypothetical protein